MTKRRKLYREKRKATKLRESRAIDAVLRGVNPDNACKYFSIHDKRTQVKLEEWYIPKRKSWIEKAKEKFFSKLNSDVDK